MEPKLVTHPDELAVLEELRRREPIFHRQEFSGSRVALERLTADLYLLTYTLLQQDVRRTRRASLWQRRGTDWRILFHQGTLVQDER